MKTNAKKLSIVLFTLTVGFFGCKKESLSPLPASVLSHKSAYTESHKSAYTGNLSKPALNNNTAVDQKIGKSWIITSFYYRNTLQNKDKQYATALFKDWNFVFSGNGEITATTKKGDRISGKWSRGTDLKYELTLDFGAQYPFNLLNDEWIMAPDAQSTVWKFLDDKDGRDGRTGGLVFEREEMLVQNK